MLNVLSRCSLTLTLVLLFTDITLAGPLEDVLLIEKFEKATKAGNLESAERLSKEVSDPNMKTMMIVEIYEKFMKKNDLKSAERLSKEVSDPNMKTMMIVEIYEKFMKKNDLKSAARLSTEVSDPNMKNMMIMELVSNAIKLKKCAMAKPLIEKASAMLKPILRMEYKQNC